MIDVHTHLDRIIAHELPGALERAAAAGVTGIVTVGMDLASSETAVALAHRFPGVYAAPGIHPWEAAGHSSDEAIATIQQLAGRQRVVAIGEIGLDYEGNVFTGESYSGEAAREVQCEVFRRQLQVATVLNLPIIVHGRASHRDIATMLAAAGPPAGAVIQFLSGTEADVKAYVEVGCYLSVGGPVTDPRMTELHRAVRAIPLDRLVLETDAPYVAPVWKGKAPSEPADIPALAAYIAALLALPIEEVIETTTHNACKLYRSS